jgi:hypothetical protein
MLRSKWIALPLILLVFAMFANAGSYTVDVYATLGPNYYGSPSYDTFVDNVIGAVRANQSSAGSGAAAYNVINQAAPNQFLVSTFYSWQGTAPGAYAGEYGTDLYFVLHIKATDAQFSLSQVSYHETEPFFPIPIDYSYNHVTDTYANDLRGYVGGVLTYSSGELGTLPVDELIYVGEFIGIEPNSYTGNDQADLDAAAANLKGCCGSTITGEYTLAIPVIGVEGVYALYYDQADVLIGPDGCDIPEPGTIAFAAMGFAAMLLVRRKR